MVILGSEYRLVVLCIGAQPRNIAIVNPGFQSVSADDLLDPSFAQFTTV